MNYLRTSGNNQVGLSPTAQYKKVLMKGPMPLMGGKVLDDNDDEEDDDYDDDMDEQSPKAAQGMMGGRSQTEENFNGQASPQQLRDQGKPL